MDNLIAPAIVLAVVALIGWLLYRSKTKTRGTGGSYTRPGNDNRKEP